MTTFAATLTTLNTGTLALLGNCTVLWPGGSTAGLFANGYVDALGVGNYENIVRCQSSAITALSAGSVITIDGYFYTVRELRPDGNGMTALVVEAV
jgi:hypothetical protein